MNNVNKYLKIARDAVIKPEERMEEKILDRISNIDEEEKERVLDERFLDFLNKSNSRTYQLEQKIRSHPGVSALGIIFILGIIALLAYIARTVFTEE